MHFLLEGTCQERNVPIDPQPLQLFLSPLVTMSNYICNKQIAMPFTPTELTNPINYLQMASMYLPQRGSQTCSWRPSSSDLFCPSVRLSLSIFLSLWSCLRQEESAVCVGIMAYLRSSSSARPACSGSNTGRLRTLQLPVTKRKSRPPAREMRKTSFF